jgi:hypothetical protein
MLDYKNIKKQIMKYSHKNLAIIGFITVLLFQVSCQKDSFTKANVNPNAPETVVPANILPAVETNLAYTQGGDIARFTSLFMQQDIGFSRQAQAYYNYVLTSTDFDTPWGNMYTSVLGNNIDLLKKADAGAYNQYSGIARILMAYSLQILVDLWGDIPYSQALQASSNTHPVFDDDRALYDTIKSLVTIGIGQLNNPETGAQTPGSDDLIYGGDISKWEKFGHAILARLYIHQSKDDPAMATNALAEAALSFTGNEDNAQYVFGTAETAGNPVYQFNQQRADIDYGAGTLVDLMIANSDPRLTVLTTPDYSDVSGVGIGDYYGAINGHVEFITYDEVLFLQAEATLRSTGDIAAAELLYQQAITANMAKLGIPDAEITAYLAAHGSLPSTIADAINAVAQEEYVSLYLNPEAWTLWRRTNTPNLTPVSGSNGIPRRFLYPQNEYSLNGSNVPPNTTLYAPLIFWDN